MPYASDAQRRFFNANREELKSQGVDVDEWNDASRGKKLPERKKKKEKISSDLAANGHPSTVAAQARAAVKQAIAVEEGGPISRVTASTLGRLNPLTLQSLLATSKAYSDPSRNLLGQRDEDRVKKHEETARLMEQYDPEALKNTVLRLGGTDVVDDLLYQKERGRNLPWTQRIGGRVWQNPHTSIVGKALGTVSTPIQNLITVLTRGSNYNPYTDVATVYQNDDPVTEHELGHALDFNKLYGVRTGDAGSGFGNFMKRQGKGVLRDLYTAGYQALPPLRLLHEARANIESQKALNKSLQDSPETLARRNKRRLEVLPAGYGSYIGDAVVPGIGGLPGMAVGRAIGQVLGQAYDQSKKTKNQERKKPEKTEEKTAALSALQSVADRIMGVASKGKKLMVDNSTSRNKGGLVAGLSELLPLAAGGALAGGIGGGVLGALRDPGVDEEGKRKSRAMQALKHSLGGAAAGAVGLPLGVAGGQQIGQHLSRGAAAQGLAALFPKRAANAADILKLAGAAAKLARCWKGYEPVPGKTPYSEDSCRPVGSAPKAKKKEKQAALAAEDRERHWRRQLAKLKARTIAADEIAN